MLISSGGAIFPLIKSVLRVFENKGFMLLLDLSGDPGEYRSSWWIDTGVGGTKDNFGGRFWNKVQVLEVFRLADLKNLVLFHIVWVSPMGYLSERKSASEHESELWSGGRQAGFKRINP